jgi:hypothetical protein
MVVMLALSLACRDSMSEEAEPQQVFEELKRGNHRFWIGTVWGENGSYWRLTDYVIMTSYYPCSLYRRLPFP